MTHSIMLFESNLNIDTCFKNFTGKTFGAAVLDSGVSKIVYGKTWNNCSIESLSIAEKSKVVYSCHGYIFKFGDGRKNRCKKQMHQ